MYDGDLNDEDVLLKWLIEQKMTDTIEEVTEEILKMLVEDEEYIAVYFSGPCDDPEDKCAKILEQLEDVDSKMQDYGIMLVTTEERELAKQHDVRSFPALGLFRNGDFVSYEGDLENEFGILEWITDKKTLELPGKIEEVNHRMLEKLIEIESDILVFLHRDGNLADNDIVDQLENIDDDLEEKGIELVRCSEKGVEKELGFGFTPVLVFYHDQIPNVFHGDLEEENEVLTWLLETMEKSQIEEVSGPILDALIERLDSLAVIFYNNDEENDQSDGEDASGDEEEEASGEDADDDKFLAMMETLDDDMDKINMALVKVNDEAKALEFGLEELPALMYFKDEVPGLYDGSMLDSEEVLAWLTTRVTEDNIQLVSDQILEDLVEKVPYVACLFTGSCAEGDETCQDAMDDMLAEIEVINDDIEDSAGILLVKNQDKRMAKRELGVGKLPALVLFKNGMEHHEQYPGDLGDSAALFNWMSDVETLEIDGKIEHVNEDMLANIVESEDDVLVFFHDDDQDDGALDEIVEGLERLDDSLSSEEVEFVRCSDEDVIDAYGLNMLPSLVYFDAGVPIVYTSGDLKNNDAILGWITQQLQASAIHHVEERVLDSALERLDYVAVMYYDADESSDEAVVAAFEDINDECKMHDIRLVKASDPKLLADIGVEAFPALVYYENDVPFLYGEHPLDAGDVDAALEWLVEQRNTAAIEEVTDAMLREVIEEHEYVAVLFAGLCSPTDEEEDECAQAVDSLEDIDTNLDEYGIVFVRTAVGQMDVAKEHWISKFPALAFFRNGEYLKFKGELTNEGSVLKWLTSHKSLMLSNQIEEVNELLLSKLIQRKKCNMFVFFYDDEDLFSRKIIKQLEELDDELEAANIDLVKISDEDIEEEYDECESGLPCLVHFKRGTEPRVFYGDFGDFEEIHQWMDDEAKRIK